MCIGNCMGIVGNVSKLWEFEMTTVSKSRGHDSDVEIYTYWILDTP